MSKTAKNICKYTERDNSYGELYMPDGSAYSRDSSVTGLNNNVAVIGPSGSGKSSIMGVLNIINANSSFVISDPKGGLYRTMSELLKKMGYKIKLLDLTHPEKSEHYNPLCFIKNTFDIRKLAHQIVIGNNSEMGHTSKDPYWDNNAEALLCALIGLMYEEKWDDSKRTLTQVMKMVSRIEPLEDVDERKSAPIFSDFISLEEDADLKGKESWAARMFKPYHTLSEKTLSCIISSLTSTLLAFESEEIAKLFDGNDFDFRELAEQKCAFFVVVSDNDRTNDTLANIFYTQAMNSLCDYADNFCENGKLKVPVTFLLDDFSTNCKIIGFENIISNIRARNISAVLMLQSVEQLSCGYGLAGQVIINNCDTIVFMGANSPYDADYFSKRANKPLHEIYELPIHSSWVFRRSEKARCVKNINPNEYYEKIKGEIEKEFFEKHPDAQRLYGEDSFEAETDRDCPDDFDEWFDFEPIEDFYDDNYLMTL